ncbi:MAG: SprB repeat-containing protein [Bacteroidetes bacterium]|nr:SprB repeat-containing protein [Bacteroidota bacterium]
MQWRNRCIDRCNGNRQQWHSNYLWNDGDTNEDRTGLAAGTYTVTATDAAGCIETGTFTVTEPALLGMNGTPTDVTTNGGSDGSIDVTATGGTTPYTYLWNDGDTNEDRTNLTAGTYTVTVTDANGCTEEATFTINEPNCKLTASIAKTNVTCYGGNDGTATVSVLGGLAPYSYSWSNGSTTKTATGLSAGFYNVIVTDGAGCTAKSVICIFEPTQIVITSKDAPATCSACDGSSTISATGGTSPYTYLWSDGQTTASAKGLCAGNYTVTVTDKKGCTQSAIILIGGTTSKVNVGITKTHVISCRGGSDGALTAIAIDGVAPYVYVWSNGQTGSTASSLTAGIYTVTATDANGCSATSSYSLTQPSALLSSTTSTNATCGNCNGTATITAMAELHLTPTYGVMVHKEQLQPHYVQVHTQQRLQIAVDVHPQQW